MAAATPSVFPTKLKLIEPLKSITQGNKFLKWTEYSPVPIIVDLKCDEKCLILYWRDFNKNSVSTPREAVPSSKSFRRSEKDTNTPRSDFLDIAFIRDVRTGEYANTPKDKNLKESLSIGKANISIKEKTISIYYGNDFFNLTCVNFVSITDDAVEIAREWTDFLFKCATSQRMQNLSPWEHLLKLRSYLIYGRAVFDEKTHEFKLPVQTIVDTFISNSKQNNDSERQHILHMLQSVGLPYKKNEMIDEKTFSTEKFFQFFLRLVSKEEIEQIFTSYAASKRKLHLNGEQFENFLNKEQRDPGLNELLYPFYTTEKASEMIQKYETDESFYKKKQLSPQGLIRYLMDYENEIIDPVKYELNEDMEQPLSHYFINSSHNTYLTGHQITGKSDAEMYRQVLLSGCRCIELDCHEDDNLDEPIITHGRTFCTKILFSEAIRAIKESAFKTSPYPVLLSFENFCGKPMQEKMAKYLVDILGDNLLREPLPDFPPKPGQPLPSPEDLKYKILVKFKRKRSEKAPPPPPPFVDKPRIETQLSDSRYLRSPSVGTNFSESEQLASNSLDSAGFVVKKKISYTFRNNSQQTNSDSESEKEEDVLRKQEVDFNPMPLSPCVSAVSTNSAYSRSHSFDSEKDSLAKKTTLDMISLVNYIQPVTFRTFEISQKRDRSFEISSFVETNAIYLTQEKSTEFVNYNKRQFSRIYPKGTRISSDNFLPQTFWNVGCQLVALNFQTLDLGMQLNQGKFEYNNRTGYLLKPEIMRRTDVNKIFDPFAESPLDGIVASTLTIKIISGIFLNANRNESERRLGYTVTVRLFGLPADTLHLSKTHRVKASSSNIFNVVYSDPGFTFKKIIMPQLALLVITVFDEQNKKMGLRVLPVVGLRPGYRYICLKNEINQPLNMSCLFVRIKLHDYVPEEFEEFANALVNPINYVMSLSKKEEMLRTLVEETETSQASAEEAYVQVDLNNNGHANHSSYDVDNDVVETCIAMPSLSRLASPSRDKEHLNDNFSKQTPSQITVESKKRNQDHSPILLTHSHSTLQTQTNPNSKYLSRSPKAESRLSLSVEKFGVGVLGKQSSVNDVKRKSQSDLLTCKSLSLSASMCNMSRSCSLHYNELECLDLKKLNITNKSQLNDPSLFREIEIEELKANKSYAHLAKNFSKKIDRVEKECEKKISELVQSLYTDMERIACESQKIKSKLDKFSQKQQSKNKLFAKNLKISKSTPNLEATPEFSFKEHLQDANVNLAQLMLSIRQKYVDDMLRTYEDTFKTIREFKINSVQPLCSRLEKQIQEIIEHRTQQLKQISDKEIANVNKQVHQQIKAKKKKAAQTAQNKEEFQRLSREIEKESVALAVSENSKMEDLLKAKQRLLKQVTDKAMNSLKEYKERELLFYENEMSIKLSEKQSNLKKTYLPANGSNLENENESNSLLKIDFKASTNLSLNDLKPNSFLQTGSVNSLSVNNLSVNKIEKSYSDNESDIEITRL